MVTEHAETPMPISAWQPETGYLPPSLRTRLLAGSVGSLHLLPLALEALRPPAPGIPSDPRLIQCGLDLLLAAWEDDPLNGDLAGQVAPLVEKTNPGDPLLPVLIALAALWKEPADLKYFQRLAQNLEFAKLHTFLDRQGEKDPGNMYWLQQAWAIAEVDGDLDTLQDRLANHWPEIPALASLREYVLANLAFLRGEYSLAHDHYAAAELDTSLWRKPSERRAECVHRLGDTSAALAIWAEIIRARPWHSSLILHAHDLALGRHLGQGKFDGTLAALIYTYNKAPDLDRAMASLAKSTDWDFCVALNNGSKDATSEVLASWQERLGQDRIRIVELPVNVGAPTARNWLASLAEVQASDYLAYLDDDAILPLDWVGHFAAARDAYPEAGVWGCRVMDYEAGFTVQSADQHMVVANEFMDPNRGTLPPDDEFDLSRLQAAPFRLSALPSLTPGYGLFSYVRPCAAVTGCCHLFATPDFLAGPRFDIRLSPSQYDDVERDLRQALIGKTACYQGFLGVDHLKRSGKAVRSDPAQLGNGLANRYKMYRLFTPHDVSAITTSSRAAVEQDLLAKLSTIQDWLPGP